jgi:hypothetical protein
MHGTTGWMPEEGHRTRGRFAAMLRRIAMLPLPGESVLEKEIPVKIPGKKIIHPLRVIGSN